MLFIDPAAGGGVEIDQQGYLVGGPELCIEIAHTTASVDLNLKKTLYEQAGVREYIVWLARPKRAVVFRLVDSHFEELPLEGGLFQSEVFPGLTIDFDKVAAGNSTGALATLQTSLGSSEHAAFVEQLANAKKAL